MIKLWYSFYVNLRFAKLRKWYISFLVMNLYLFCITWRMFFVRVLFEQQRASSHFGCSMLQNDAKLSDISWFWNCIQFWEGCRFERLSEKWEKSFITVTVPLWARLPQRVSLKSLDHTLFLELVSQKAYRSMSKIKSTSPHKR